MRLKSSAEWSERLTKMKKKCPGMNCPRLRKRKITSTEAANNPILSFVTCKFRLSFFRDVTAIVTSVVTIVPIGKRKLVSLYNTQCFQSSFDCLALDFSIRIVSQGL